MLVVEQLRGQSVSALEIAEALLLLQDRQGDTGHIDAFLLIDAALRSVSNPDQRDALQLLEEDIQTQDGLETFFVSPFSAYEFGPTELEFLLASQEAELQGFLNCLAAIHFKQPLADMDVDQVVSNGADTLAPEIQTVVQRRGRKLGSKNNKSTEQKKNKIQRQLEVELPEWVDSWLASPNRHTLEIKRGENKGKWIRQADLIEIIESPYISVWLSDQKKKLGIQSKTVEELQTEGDGRAVYLRLEDAQSILKRAMHSKSVELVESRE